MESQNTTEMNIRVANVLTKVEITEFAEQVKVGDLIYLNCHGLEYPFELKIINNEPYLVRL